MRVAIFTALILLLASCAPAASSPFLPALGDPASRQSIFAAEMAKHPEAGCSAFSELYVETNGKRAIWHIKCSSGLIVAFFFGEKGVLDGVQPEGTDKSE